MAPRSAIPLVALLCLVVALARAEDTKPPENPDLTAANQLFQSGKFGEAIPRYQQALQVDPKLVPAQAGLVRAYLRDEQVDKAFDLATTSLAAQPNSASLLSAMGAVQYRRGEIYGNPWLRLLRREVEELVSSRHGEGYLRERQARTELKRVNRQLKQLRAQVAELERRRLVLLAELGEQKP